MGMTPRQEFAEVALTRSDDTVLLTIPDQGAGMNLNQHVASGALRLTSIRERTRLVEGRFEMQSKLNQGTTLRVVLPLTAL